MTTINYRAARLAKGLTQVDLSRRVAVSQQQISNIETGRSRPGAGTRIRLARVLGLPAE
jgi:transcriptional regulator with XRE-family HTH domain